MRLDTIGLSFAVILTGAVAAAQDTRTTTDTTVKSDNGKVITMTGCVMIGGATNFLLANITPKPDEHDKTELSAGGSYALVEREGLDLSSYIDHRVELTGVVVPAATKGDHDDKIKIKETTKVDSPNASDKKSSTSATVKVARGPANQFLVASVKALAPTCGR